MNFREIEEKWQRRWDEAHLFEPRPDPTKPKYFITAAYPYPNGAIHIGHGRTYLIADILARYHRHKGYNVLFPMGFHYTGTPILTVAEAIAAGDRATAEDFKAIYGVPDEEIERMGDPLYLARYFHNLSKEYMRKFGLSIDWTREFTTIDPEYQQFIRWQFKKLYDKGYVVRGRHPVGWCPKHGMPVGAHDTKDDKEPEIDRWTLIYFESRGLIFPAATLRPETVLGVTNMWINPDEDYVVADVEGKRIVLSADAAFRLSFQAGVRILERAKGADFVGRKARNPVTGDEVPIYPAKFVDPRTGTGVVMSVPAHAPYDYAALRELGEVRLIPLIKVEGYGEYPAKDVVERMGIRSQTDPKLEDATKEVYSAEHARGVMRDDVAELVGRHLPEPARSMVRGFFAAFIAGKPVAEARRAMAEWMEKAGIGGHMYDVFNKPVYCRCGTEIVVKILEDQWFLNYGDLRWKEAARELIDGMRLIPPESKAQFLATVDWLDKRACARTRGLGTPLPWDSKWIIESLSDSTIYMAYYAVIRKIREAGLTADRLTEEFWDYVFLGRGSPEELAEKLGVDAKTLKAIREEFVYWYPLDSRNSGKDLIPNHLTFFIFNHAAIFPKELWPRQVVANGWVLVEGEKMSKSRRNVLALGRAVDQYGSDVLRATLAVSSEVEQDLDFRSSVAKSVAKHLEDIYSLATSIIERALRDGEGLAERWLKSEVALLLAKIGRALDAVAVRQAAVYALYDIKAVFERYLKMVDAPSKAVSEALKAWIIAMEPFVPHLAEELWEKIGERPFAATAPWPKLPVDKAALLSMRYVDLALEDAAKVLEVVGKAKRIVFYVDGRYQWARLAASSKDVRELISAGVPGALAKRLLDHVRQMDEELQGLIKDVESFDEYGVLDEAKVYLAKALGAEIVVYKADDPAAPDLGGKKRAALPLKPGIYVERA
ncbi:MAG: leucine--tRNA ligase [Thermoproteus sp.]|nr:leucine--tRNA ligase [Thermoproteus sp.]